MVNRDLLSLASVVIGAAVVAAPACARKLDYASHKVVVEDPEWGGSWVHGLPAYLADGIGAEPYPVAPGGWARADAPKDGKPAVAIFDYGVPVKVAALGHYFYVPGCRDQKSHDWLSGPSAFREAKIYLSDDKTNWREVAHFQDLPSGCPQLLKIDQPASARYLKLEVLSLAPGTAWLRSYEIETYVDEAPDSLPSGNKGKAQRLGFPNDKALAPADTGSIALDKDSQRLKYRLRTATGETTGSMDIRVSDQAVTWDPPASGKTSFTGKAGSERLDVQAQFVKAGMLLRFKCHGPVTYPMAKLDVIARPDTKPAEWCIPEYHYSNTEAPANIGIPSAAAPTCVSIVSDGKHSLSWVPDSDRSWVGVLSDGVYVSYPLGDEDPSALLVAADGGWFSGFSKAVGEVFDFNEPRQFAPVTATVETLFGYLMQPSLWSEKYQMMRSFPDTDFFYLFYGMPFAIPAYSSWHAMTGDSSVDDRIIKMLRFTLDRRVRDGAMKGAIFSLYADRALADSKTVPFAHPPYYEWYTDYPDEQLVGMCQGCNRWFVAHTPGAVLYSISYALECRGELPKDIMDGARDVADWMVRFMKEDGSWSYAYKDDGSIASPQSGSGTIWNVWGLYRFGKLTGDRKYSDAAARAADYFRNTFIKNHLYRGYWEDNYGGGATELNTAQGYESSIAAMAFAEMGDNESAISAARDGMRYVCTRTLESRTYWTSYGGASEQQAWSPATYISPTFGRAAQLAWLQGGDEFSRRFSGLAKTIGWWMDSTGTSFWIGEAVGQNPIEMWRRQGGQRSYWVQWDCAQKAVFALQWLIDDVNRRSGNRMKISPMTLKGTDDQGTQVAVRLFNGTVDSTNGQVNWLWLKTDRRDGRTGWQLVLINHFEATDVTVRVPLREAPTSIRMLNEKGQGVRSALPKGDNEFRLNMPEQAMAIINWE